MAENKKAFVLYADMIHTLDHLTLEQRGEVITWILQYVNDNNPKPLKGLLGAVIEPFKQQLKRDLDKWERQVEQRREAGRKSAEARKRRKEIAETVNDCSISSTDNVSVTDNVIYKETKQSINNYFCKIWKEESEKRFPKDKVYLKNLDSENKEKVFKLYKDYGKEYIFKIIVALFKQKEYFSEVMRVNPKHVIEHHLTYIQAYDNKNVNIWKGKEKKQML